MPPKAAAKAKKTDTAIPKAGAKSKDPLADTKQKLVAASTTAPLEACEVDDNCSSRNRLKVVQHEGRNLSVYLMWADLKDNKNKFYVAQCLKDDKGKTYLWTRYGRVGVVGVFELADCDSYDKGVKDFLKKEREKVKKGYNEIKMALGKSSAPAPVVVADNRAVAPSKLDANVQDFVSLIFNKKLMEDGVVKGGFDVKKMPLGELKKETIDKGYQILIAIENVLAKKSKEDLVTLTGQFYTQVPHSFGMQKMINFLIDTEDKLKEKMDLINNLKTIQDALEMLKTGEKPKPALKQVDLKPNPIDENYKLLNCKMETLDRQSKDFKLIDQYVQAGKGYHKKLTVVDAFKIQREGELAGYNPKKLGNKTLLWHGSRFSNFSGILSKGLLIAPPEAPSTGYNFGKGVYFADMIEKSFHYARPQLSNDVGIYVLGEVALGNQRELHQSNHQAQKLQDGKDSTHAMGTRYPDPAGSQLLDGDVTVPTGKIIENKKNGWHLNEFIVYNTNQIRMRYIVRITNK